VLYEGRLCLSLTPLSSATSNELSAHDMALQSSTPHVIACEHSPTPTHTDHPQHSSVSRRRIQRVQMRAARTGDRFSLGPMTLLQLPVFDLGCYRALYFKGRSEAEASDVPMWAYGLPPGARAGPLVVPAVRATSLSGWQQQDRAKVGG
jgi:hypothetical protein